MDPAALDWAEALDWLDAERANLVAAIIAAAAAAAAAADGRPAAWLLADGLRGYFPSDVHSGLLGGGAVGAGRVGGARATCPGRRAAHLSLSDLYRRLGRYEPSITHVRRALELAGEAGWAAGESVALGNLGNAEV